MSNVSKTIALTALMAIPAAIIDSLQAFVAAGVFGLFTVTGLSAPIVGAGVGGVGGCILGGAAGALIGAFAGGIGAIPGAVAGCAAAGTAGATAGSVFGSAVTVASEPLGAMVGYVMDLAIGLGGGAILVTLLLLSKMFYPGTVFGVFLGEAMPFVDVLPGWTLLVLRSGYKKWKEEKNAQVQTPQESGSGSENLYENTLAA